MRNPALAQEEVSFLSLDVGASSWMLCVGDRLKMAWVHTTSVPAEVVQDFPLRDSSDDEFVSEAVRVKHLC